MLKVWVLILYMSAVNQGGPAVIDNIATKEECERIRDVMHQMPAIKNDNTVCVSVTKAKL